MANRSPIAILGVPFDNISLAETCSLAGTMIESRYPHYATTVGVDFLLSAQSDIELRRILFDAHLIVAEENLVVWASKKLGNPLPGSVTVPNLIPQLFVLAEAKNWRVFLLGGDDAAAQKIRTRHPKLNLVGTYKPEMKPLLEMDHTDILRRVRDAKPDILLVAFGCPTQEKWINMNYRTAGVPFVLGAGTGFNFITGESRTRTGAVKKIQFIIAVMKQWWKLRIGKKAGDAPQADVMPDPQGNLIIRAPKSLGAAESAAAQSEWQRAVENSNVFFDLSETEFADSTGIGALIRLRKRSRELNYQFILIAPRPQVEAALKLMKLEDFFTVQASVSGAKILMESAAGVAPVSSGVSAEELQIRWTGEITTLNAVELGAYTESELTQASPGMTVVIDLARVTFVDSTGIGLMVRFKKNLTRQNIKLKFINVLPSVRNVIRATQLEAFLLGEG